MRPIRIVTAAALFDGHDAAINIVRRLLQAQGAEVIHLGHDRSVDEIAEAAVEEDADAVAVSSYQGGHMEFFRYLVGRLAEQGASDVRVYGGGGGTITRDEIAALEGAGVARIFDPAHGRALGLDGMIAAILGECAERAARPADVDPDSLSPTNPRALARVITRLEEAGVEGGDDIRELRARLESRRGGKPAPVIGFTGTGGAGKSSVVDEIVRRFRRDLPDTTIGLLLVDPSRRRSSGALLGDRIRMNAIGGSGVYTRSLATRQPHRSLPASVRDATLALQAAAFGLILVETAGIGQADSEIIDLADLSVYVMTPEYGAPSQLEKIDMLDLADVAVLNKFDRRGAADALRDVRKQWQRNRRLFGTAPEELPVFPTVARAWNDPGTESLYAHLRARAFGPGDAAATAHPAAISAAQGTIPPSRARYLAEIAETVRRYHAETERQARAAAEADGLGLALRALGDAPPSEGAGPAPEADDPAVARLRPLYAEARRALSPEVREQLADWDATRARYDADTQTYEVRDRTVAVRNRTTTLSETPLPRVALPRTDAAGELTRFFRQENLPGRFPFTAGVFPFRREDEDPTRMFAGEGGPERTNRRFHYLARGHAAARLSTAFDSVTLYGRDPDPRPDVYGKVGNSGVSVCTLDDAAKLYSGFDLCDPRTSVSMTINGPAPVILAFFLNAAVDQGVEKHLRQTGALETLRRERSPTDRPTYSGPRPEGHDGLGLGLLGLRADRLVPREVYERIRGDVLRRIRGTVQADILKEDQAQNTCIFSTDFALGLMGDVQEYFIRNEVQNFYSVSVSGYHIAEAGANPITQLAFTLANGFTYCEYYLARGMKLDDFAANFSFFFSNGLDAEYSVIGRVARRIWAVAMRERYGAAERSQKLKYHVQTSGRSLHAQEMAFNDIRTTLQALTALQDQCNSLHTNAYDEAVTTPTEESVRRAVAIQLVIQRELGLSRNENPLQGSYAIEWLTDAVEDAVLREFERLSERGGVLGAMETLYQRGRIQDESLRYETLKHSGELPVVGVNTFENPHPDEAPQARELMRSTDDEKRTQLDNLRAFHRRNRDESGPALARLQDVARTGGNVFAELLETTRVASLGQITEALFEVGGRYRRAM